MSVGGRGDRGWGTLQRVGSIFRVLQVQGALGGCMGMGCVLGWVPKNLALLLMAL